MKNHRRTLSATLALASIAGTSSASADQVQCVAYDYNLPGLGQDDDEICLMERPTGWGPDHTPGHDQPIAGGWYVNIGTKITQPPL